MKSKIISFILAASMIITLVSCGKSSSSSGVSASDSNASNWNPKVSQREILKSKGSMCGVYYVTYSIEEMEDMKKDSKYYQKVFDRSGIKEKFPFLKKIPDSQIVSTQMGTEIYLIIPADKNAEVAVYLLELDEETFTSTRAEKPLYKSHTGAPFVLQCNYSDLFSEVEIEITDSEGEKLSWKPFVSLRDGSVYNKTDDGKEVYDFTEYRFANDPVQE